MQITDNWALLFTHSTALPGVPRQQQDNKLFCATSKARQAVLPSRESLEQFKDFLDDTFAKSTTTKYHKTGECDGVCPIANTKYYGHVPHQNEY